jgi:2'-5' RNA ligase
MKRLFAAIKLHPTEAFLSRYYAVKRNLQDEKIKWVAPENIHITLKFLGETPDHHIPGINLALKEAANCFSPFRYELENIGIFGSSYKPRVIWMGIHDKGVISELAASVFKQLEHIGIEKDRQNFVPHLTIARIKSIQDKKHFQEVIEKYREGGIQKEEVNQFHLFESILRPEGPEYTILKSFTLGLQ